MVTKQVTGIVVDKSIEDIDSIIHECTEKLSTNDIISKSQVNSMLRKIRSFEIRMKYLIINLQLNIMPKNYLRLVF